MRSFDLTFSGNVMPKSDPLRVKEGFARLFSIEDSDLIEEIFSGKTIVLRHNLDRKTAANYFQQIKLLGAEASLVKSPRHRSVGRDEILLPQPDLEAVIIGAQPTGQLPDKKLHEHVETPSENLAATGTETQSESRKDKADIRAALRRQKELYKRIANEELEKLKYLRMQNQQQVEQALKALQSDCKMEKDAASAKLEEMALKIAQHKQSRQQDILEVDQEIESEKAAGEQKIRELKAQRADTSERTEKEIGRLQQLIEEARGSDKEDQLRCKKSLEETEAELGTKIKILGERKEAASRKRDTAIIQLQEDKQTVHQELALQMSAINQQESAIKTTGEIEIERLTALELQIQRECDHGVSLVEASLRKLDDKN